MEHQHQIAAFALLLCSPSKLHTACMTDDAASISEELTALGFSDAAKAVALQSWPRLRGCMKPLGLVTPVLRDILWAGQEPHPGGPIAGNIVRTMRELDLE